MLNSMYLNLQAIIVPQGQEYQVVCRAVQNSNSNLLVIPIPIGSSKFVQQLEKCLDGYSFNQALLLGLCGSLSVKNHVCDRLIYQNCKIENKQIQSLRTNFLITNSIYEKLNGSANLIDNLTSDRLICEVETKKELAEIHQTNAVDMESYHVLAECKKRSIDLGIVRVVSDGLDFDLPDLSDAIVEGEMIAEKLAIAMISQPCRSYYLVKNALKALKELENCTRLILS
jgi:hypothetical protein